MLTTKTRKASHAAVSQGSCTPEGLHAAKAEAGRSAEPQPETKNHSNKYCNRKSPRQCVSRAGLRTMSRPDSASPRATPSNLSAQGFDVCHRHRIWHGAACSSYSHYARRHLQMKTATCFQSVRAWDPEVCTAVSQRGVDPLAPFRTQRGLQDCFARMGGWEGRVQGRSSSVALGFVVNLRGFYKFACFVNWG